jgi:hypothetical protein
VALGIFLSILFAGHRALEGQQTSETSSLTR